MSNLSDIERELDQARGNLSHTLEEVNRKAASAGSGRRISEQHIRSFPISSLCGAMALGFAAGGAPAPAMIFGVIVLGAALMGPKDGGRCEDGLKNHNGFGLGNE